jgi:hypothetical protein
VAHVKKSFPLSIKLVMGFLWKLYKDFKYCIILKGLIKENKGFRIKIYTLATLLLIAT